MIRSVTKHIILLTAIVIISFSCTDRADCSSDNTSQIVLRFWKENDVDLDSIFFEKDTLTYTSIYVASKEDSIIYDESDSLLDSLTFFLDPLLDSTVIIFEDDIKADTIVIKYDRLQRLISPICGAEQFYINIDTGNYTFDSLSMVNTVLKKGSEVDVEIFSF